MLKKNISKLKDMVGKTVWLLPTGNNSRRWSESDGLIQATVVKVGRVNVTIRIVDYSYNEVYRVADYADCRLYDDCNGGYVIFPSELDYVKYKKGNDLRRKISDFFSTYGRNVEKLTLDQLGQIDNIISGNEFFNKEMIKPSEYPADIIPSGGKVLMGVDEGSPDGDCTVKGFYKDGVFHIQEVERSAK